MELDYAAMEIWALCKYGSKRDAVPVLIRMLRLLAAAERRDALRDEEER